MSRIQEPAPRAGGVRTISRAPKPALRDPDPAPEKPAADADKAKPAGKAAAETRRG